MLLEIILMGDQDDDIDIIVDSSFNSEKTRPDGYNRCTIDLDRVNSVIDAGDCINIYLYGNDKAYITDSFTYGEFISKWNKNQEDQIF
jgi:hypothetical protein